ncbi:MAG: ABC transporter ATP-binding protein [Actinomycetota bacterium]|jgi:ABC-type multidrug transport system fused ATPase/permease subunit
MTLLTLPYRELPATDIGTPNLSSPLRYLVWLGRKQILILSGAVVFGMGWMLSQALLWAAVGGAIDHGITPRNPTALWHWVEIVLILGIVQGLCGAMRHQLAVANWMTATYRSIQLIGRHITASGTAVIDEIPAGDVVNTVGADVMRIGGAFDVVGRLVGALVSWIVVSIILLSTSLSLGLVVLLGVPLLASLTTPLMKPLHSTQAAQREAAGRLAALGADTVAGLRILRGVGGEEVFLANYKEQSNLVRVAGNRIAGPQAALESGQLLLPALLVAVVTFLGARDIVAGRLQPGQLVAFFGYATFLTTPLRTVIEYIISSTRALVGAKKVLRILNATSAVEEPSEALAWPEHITSLHDGLTGVTLHRGQLTALVTETPAEAAEIANRLGRFVGGKNDVRLNDIPLAHFSLADTRRHIVVSEVEPRLFTGDLRSELAPRGAGDDERLITAMAAASALDILDALDQGFDSTVEERGRSFSGGQRQRIALARAYLTEADILILVEPTSAVDSHTESRIASRMLSIRDQRSTLIATTSPLILEKVDVVLVVRDGRVSDQGAHRDLARTNAWYRSVVLREEDE